LGERRIEIITKEEKTEEEKSGVKE